VNVRLCSAERGAVFAEYVVVLSLVSLGCALAIVSLGPLLVRSFLVQQAVLLLPLPV
jgi:hypothetical protein